MQARCQLQRRPTFLPSNFYFLRARQGGRSHHATNYESGAKCSADIRVPLAPPSGSAVAAGLRSCGVLPAPAPPPLLAAPGHYPAWVTCTGVCGRDLRLTTHHAVQRVMFAGCHPFSNTSRLSIAQLCELPTSGLVDTIYCYSLKWILRKNIK